MPNNWLSISDDKPVLDVDVVVGAGAGAGVVGVVDVGVVGVRDVDRVEADVPRIGRYDAVDTVVADPN